MGCFLTSPPDGPSSSRDSLLDIDDEAEEMMGSEVVSWSSDEEDQDNPLSHRFVCDDTTTSITLSPNSVLSCPSTSTTSLAVLSGHVGSVSCLALCGEFLLSASQGTDIRVWQHPDLRPFAHFGHGDGAVKALVVVGARVFTAHQDSRIRVWRLSQNGDSPFKLVATMPTTRDYFSRCMKQSNYVRTRRHHHKLWIEHADSISCLTVDGGLIYSGSWDKTLKVWRMSDLKCIESIQAHDDAVNALVAIGNGIVYSASADGTVKVWKGLSKNHCMVGKMVGHKNVSMNSIVVSRDGKWVCGGGSNGFILGWGGSSGLEEWGLVWETRAHKMAVLCLYMLGDEYLFSGSADRSIKVMRRDVNGGLVNLRVILGHEGPVKCLQACYGGGGGKGFLVYSGSLDKSLRVWWVPNDQVEGGSESED